MILKRCKEYIIQISSAWCRLVWLGGGEGVYLQLGMAHPAGDLGMEVTEGSWGLSILRVLGVGALGVWRWCWRILEGGYRMIDCLAN